MSAAHNRTPSRFAARWVVLALVPVVLALPACESDGNFSILGYSTVPNYDCNIHTVYVPIFENRTFVQGLEFALTQEVIRAIEAQTPFKVVSTPETADTELKGTIVAFTKSVTLNNQQNEVRVAETIMTVEVCWRDRRTGEILSHPAPRAADSLATPVTPALPIGAAQPVALPNGDAIPKQGATPVAQTGPAVPGVLAPPPLPAPTLITSKAMFIPEVGGSITTAEKDNSLRMARQIIQMMEKPW